MKTIKNMFTKRNPKYIDDRLRDAAAAVNANDNKETRKELYKALRGSTFLLPVIEIPKDLKNNEWITLDESNQIEFIILRDERGQSGILVFSNLDALFAWKESGCQFVCMQAPDVFSLASTNKVGFIYVNPAGPYSGIVTSEEFQALAEGGIPENTPGENKVSSIKFDRSIVAQIGPPKNSPSDELQHEITKQLTNFPNVLAAYYFTSIIGMGKPHSVIGIEAVSKLDKKSEMRIIEAVSQIFQDEFFEEGFLDLMILKDREVSKAVKQHGFQLYLRD